MKSKTIPYLFWGVFVVIGIFLIILGFTQKSKDEVFIAKSQTAQARIMDITSHVSGSGKHRRVKHRVFVSFIVNGKEYEGKISSFSSSMHVGDRITVYYNPEDPDDFISKSDAKASVVMFIMGSVFAFVGLLPAVITISSTLKKNSLLSDGDYILAHIDAVQQNRSIKVNGCYPWNIYCSFFDASTGVKYLFKSKSFYGSYDGAFEQAGITTVDVYAKPGNYKKYYVDHIKAIEMLNVSANVFRPELYE